LGRSLLGNFAAMQYLPASALNHEAYARFLSRCSRSRVYHQPWFLEAAAPGSWGAVVGKSASGEWEWVFLLNRKRKYGIPYSYKPPHVQRFGWLATDAFEDRFCPLGSEERFAFWRQLNRQLPWCYKLVTDTNFPDDLACPLLRGWAQKEGSYTERNAQYKPLKALPDEASLLATYRKDRRKNLREAQQQLRVTDALTVEAFCGWIQQGGTVALERAGGPKVLPVLQRLLQAAQQRNQLWLRAATLPTGTWASAGAFMLDNHHVYATCILKDDRYADTNGTTLLYHTAMLQALGKQQVFDFMGSDLPGVRAFNEGFGCENDPYLHLHRKRPLPFIG
jgi:hypothetical protein